MYTAKELAAQGVPAERIEIRRLRLKKRLTHAQLAKLSGLTTTIVEQFEKGAPWAIFHRERLIAALNAYEARDYAAEMRAWREVNGLTIAQAARLLGASWSTWKCAESRGFKYGPKRMDVARLEALLRTGLQPRLANQAESAA